MKINKNNILTRYFFITLIFGVVGALIIIKSCLIMFAERQYWNDVASRFIKENVVVKPNRGNILSADGKLMASSLPEYKIYMDFKAGGEKKDTMLCNHISEIAKGLHEIFPDKSTAYFKNHIMRERRKGSRNYLLYPKRITYLEYKRVKKLPVFCLNPYQGGFTGVAFNRRTKPFGSLATRTLGDLYADAAQGAKNGIELSFDSVLKGKNGVTHRQKVMNKWLNIVDIPPVDGCDVVTTIDVDMQDICEKALIDKLKEIDARVGVAVLMEVKTGDVKAIVNMTKCEDGEYREVKNNAITDMMEPGSTFKTASIMVALEDGLITPNDEVDTGNGIKMMHGREMRDWKKIGFQVINVSKIMMVSSNIGVSTLIDKHYFNNPGKYVEGLYRLGINQPLHLQIRGEGKPYIRYPNKNNWANTSLAWMSIGYETQIPPINILTFYNAIANNGKMVRPKFVKAISKNGEILKEYPTEVIKERICSTKTLSEIKEILRKVVGQGTGGPAGSKQFHVSGKTGTAQISQGKSGYKTGGTRYLVSFCGFFPSENPQYSCIVSIQKDGLPASGGSMAGGVFGKIAERVFAKNLHFDLRAAKDSTASIPAKVKNGNLWEAGHLAQELELKYKWNLSNEKDWTLGSHKALRRIPNVTGYGAKDAVYILENIGLRVQVKGKGRVTGQSIPYGSSIIKGQTITINLN